MNFGVNIATGCCRLTQQDGLSILFHELFNVCIVPTYIKVLRTKNCCAFVSQSCYSITKIKYKGNLR